jgi:hypothetical protein
MSDEINLEYELDKIVEATKVGIAAGNISENEGMQVTLLCCVGQLLIEVNGRLDDTNELLSDLLETKDGCTLPEDD